MWKYGVALGAVILIVCLCWSSPENYYITAITDGDTVKVLKDNKEMKIRLAHIDAPESKQAFGSAAKLKLSEKIFNKWVALEILNTDRYQRTIAIIKYKGRNINLEMVKEGYAWHYKHFSKEQIYEDAQNKAKAKKLGLWIDKKPIEPWNFRSN